MSSELELLKQRITELEAENVEIAELRKENTDLRNKLSVSDAEIAELKRSNNEFLRANREYNERRDAENAKLKARIEELESENIEVRDRLTKVEQKQSQNDITPNNNSSKFNSGAVHHEKPLEEKEMDSCLLEAHKKIVSEDIRRRNKEKKLQRESANQDVTFGNAYVSETVVVAPQLTSGNGIREIRIREIVYFRKMFSSKNWHSGYDLLRQGKRVAFVSTGAVMARALVEKASKLSKPDNLPVRAHTYYGDMDGKQRQKDFSDINVAWSELDCIAYTNTVEVRISFEVTGHFDIIIAITNIATPVH
ncbi:hypothetical protein RhiirA4_482003, partial [Rhizophagus irregularis]